MEFLDFALLMISGIDESVWRDGHTKYALHLPLMGVACLTMPAVRPNKIPFRVEFLDTTREISIIRNV